MLLEKLKSDIYNIEPVKTIEVDTGIKRAYFDCKKSSYNQLLEFNNNDYELLIY